MSDRSDGPPEPPEHPDLTGFAAAVNDAMKDVPPPGSDDGGPIFQIEAPSSGVITLQIVCHHFYHHQPKSQADYYHRPPSSGPPRGAWTLVLEVLAALVAGLVAGSIAAALGLPSLAQFATTSLAMVGGLIVSAIVVDKWRKAEKRQLPPHPPIALPPPMHGRKDRNEKS